MTFDPVDLFFTLFSSMMILAALGVVAFKTPIYGVLSLMVCFLNSAAVWLLLHAEFLAMVLIVVYVGAVVVFFLFVVMMCAPQTRLSLSSGAIWVTLMLAIELGSMIILAPDHVWTHPSVASSAPPLPALGSVLYTQYIVPFQMVGCVLLIAMIGAIVLVKSHHQHSLKRPKTRKSLRPRRVLLKTLPLNQGLSS